MTPALLAPYGWPLAPDFRPATDAVQTIEPDFCAIMCGVAYLIARNGPIRLMRRISIQCSTVWSAKGTSPPLTPALAQIASSLPYLDTALAMNACTSFSEPASACIASTVPPASLTSFAVSCTLSLRSTAISFAPSFVNNSDAARPMPLPAPVMMTDLPSRRPISFSLALVIHSVFQRSGYRFAQRIRANTDTLAALRNFKQDFKRRSHLRRCVL